MITHEKLKDLSEFIEEINSLVKSDAEKVDLIHYRLISVGVLDNTENYLGLHLNNMPCLTGDIQEFFYYPDSLNLNLIEIAMNEAGDLIFWIYDKLNLNIGNKASLQEYYDIQDITEGLSDYPQDLIEKVSKLIAHILYQKLEPEIDSGRTNLTKGIYLKHGPIDLTKLGLTSLLENINNMEDLECILQDKKVDLESKVNDIAILVPSYIELGHCSPRLLLLSKIIQNDLKVILKLTYEGAYQVNSYNYSITYDFLEILEGIGNRTIIMDIEENEYLEQAIIKLLLILYSGEGSHPKHHARDLIIKYLQTQSVAVFYL